MSELEQRREKLAQIKELGVDPYPHKFEWTHTAAQLLSQFSDASNEQLEASPLEVRVAGRILSMRGHGKVGFAHLLNHGERIQLYVRKDRVGDENYALYQLLDIGDLIGVDGHLFRTRTGELSIFTDQIHFLSKALLPLPEKWHGLADTEARYRQRYLDLIANPETRNIFVTRSAITREMRTFLEESGYLEVETPMMQPIAGGATARPFRTFHQALGVPLFLRIAPELYLKRLTVGGLERVYEINRNFRNEGISRQHNPEFTMLEFYVAYCDYQDLMQFTEDLLQRVVQRVKDSPTVEYQGLQIDFSSFQRLTMHEAILHYWPTATIPRMEDLAEQGRLCELLAELGVPFDPAENWGNLMGQLFDAVAEEHLMQPTFIYDYPVELSPLSKRKDADPRLVERFELFIGGFEVANAYSELNDPEEQAARFQEQLERREKGDEEAHEMDWDYVRALRHGLPPTAGEGIGVDRLTMILTNSSNIREVILFPQLRPLADQDGEPEVEALEVAPEE